MNHKILITIECEVEARDVETAEAIAEMWVTKDPDDLRDHGITVLSVEVE